MRTLFEIFGGIILLFAGFQIGIRMMARVAAEKMAEAEELSKRTFETLILKLTHQTTEDN
jgi:divalent metal cation (Fe/Co/Zn/Cd) transporter